MRKLFALVLVAGILTVRAVAQDATNAPKTEIENFELQTDTVIVKGFGQIGSVAFNGGNIYVRCKESNDVGHDQKQYGLAVEIEMGARRDLAIIDYDEIDSLLDGLDYLGKITYDATKLPSFEATLTTKSGLRIAAHSARREGGIQNYIQFPDDCPRVLLSSEQITQLTSLIDQAKNSLDALRKSK